MSTHPRQGTADRSSINTTEVHLSESMSFLGLQTEAEMTQMTQ